MYWVQVLRPWQQGLRASSVRKGPGCPMPDRAGSGRLQPTHCRAQLSPTATGRHLRESLCQKGQNTARQRGVRGKVWEAALQAPRGEQEEGEEVLQVLQLPVGSHELSHPVFSLVPLRGEWVCWVGVWPLAKANPAHMILKQSTTNTSLAYLLWASISRWLLLLNQRARASVLLLTL